MRFLDWRTHEDLNMRIAQELLGQADFTHLPFQWFEGATEDGEDGWDGYCCPRCMNTTGPCVKNYCSDPDTLGVLLKALSLVNIPVDISVGRPEQTGSVAVRLRIPGTVWSMTAYSDPKDGIERYTVNDVLCHVLLHYLDDREEYAKKVTTSLNLDG